MYRPWSRSKQPLGPFLRSTDKHASSFFRLLKTNHPEIGFWRLENGCSARYEPRTNQVRILNNPHGMWSQFNDTIALIEGDYTIFHNVGSSPEEVPGLIWSGIASALCPESTSLA